MMKLQHGEARDAAETVALRALAFLAADAERLGRFLALSGMGPRELKDNARDPAMLAGILEHLLADESLLLVFAAEASLPPETVAKAYTTLTGTPIDR